MELHSLNQSVCNSGKKNLLNLFQLREHSKDKLICDSLSSALCTSVLSAVHLVKVLMYINSVDFAVIISENQLFYFQKF